MSTMPASHGHNEACCNIPPVVATGYKARGSYEDVGGYKTYVTGPADATNFYVFYLYNQAFRYSQMGAASAMAWVLFVITLILSALIFWTSRRWVNYETVA